MDRPFNAMWPWQGFLCAGRLLSLFEGFATHFLTAAFSSQCLLDAFLLSRLQVERMFLDVLDNVFLHHLAFKATQCTFNGLTFMNPNLRHPILRIRYITRIQRCLRLFLFCNP